MKKLLGIVVLMLLAFSTASFAVEDISSPQTDQVNLRTENDTVTVTSDGEINYPGHGAINAKSTTYDATETTITNNGTINATGTFNNAINGKASTDITILNTAGSIMTADTQTIYIRKAIRPTIINHGTITARSEEEGEGRTIEAREAEDVVITNSGTITGNHRTIHFNTGDGTATLTNTNTGIIESTGGSDTTIFVERDNTTIKNSGIISSVSGNSITIISGTTGAIIEIHDAPTFTGEIELTDPDTAANTTIILGCDITKNTTVELHNKTGVNITNNLCGNDTYSLSTEAIDGSDAVDGYLIIDEGLEVVSNNATYRSENVLTKLKGLFSAANYIDGVEPEDKFFRIFYSNVKRENMYKGSMTGVLAQLSPINWGNVTSNVFLGYSKQHGDFDNGEFLGGDNYALGLKNVFTKNGLKVSFSPMIGLNDLDVTDYDSDSKAKVKTNLLSEFLALNGKIDKEIKTSESGSLNLSVQSTLGLQRFPDYLSKFSDGDLSVDEAIEQVLSGGFEVKYNEELGKGFIIRPYVGVSVNHNLNNNIDIVKDDDSKPASPADSVTSGYYAGLTLNKKTKDISFDLDLMYGNEDGLINQIVAVSLTKTFGKVKTAKFEKKSDTLKVAKISTPQDYDIDLKELEELRKANEALKAQNEKLKLLAQKTLEENEISKRLIVELIKENEKIKLEKEIFKNKILNNENKELLQQLEGSNEGNKPSNIFLIIFVTVLTLAILGLISLIASIYNRTKLNPTKS